MIYALHCIMHDTTLEQPGEVFCTQAGLQYSKIPISTQKYPNSTQKKPKGIKSTHKCSKVLKIPKSTQTYLKVLTLSVIVRWRHCQA